MDRILSYTDFPEILVRAVDHVDAHIGHDHARHEDLPVRIRFAGYEVGGTQVPESVGVWHGPALVFPATPAHPELTLIAQHYKDKWVSFLSFYLVTTDGEQLEAWEVDTEVIEPFQVCRIDVAHRATHSVSQPDTPHTLLRLPEFLQKGTDPNLPTLYDDMVCVTQRHLGG